MRTRHLLLLLLACSLTVASLAAAWYRSAWAASFTSNLAAGFLGSFLTVLLIDRALERERRTQTERVRKVAFAQLRPTILRHLILLFGWYKAAIPQQPSNPPTKLEELFNEGYFHEIRYLDFSKAGPTKKVSWFAFTGQELDSLKVEIRRAIDKYAFFLEPQTLELLEDIGNSNLVSLFVGLSRTDLVAMDRSENIQRSYNVLSQESCNRAAREHIKKLYSFLSSFNKTAIEPINLEDLAPWRADVCPTFGSARASTKEWHGPSIMMGKFADLPTH